MFQTHFKQSTRSSDAADYQLCGIHPDRGCSFYSTVWISTFPSTYISAHFSTCIHKKIELEVEIFWKNSPVHFQEGEGTAGATFDARKENALLIAPVMVSANSQVHQNNAQPIRAGRSIIKTCLTVTQLSQLSISTSSSSSGSYSSLSCLSPWCR